MTRPLERRLPPEPRTNPPTYSSKKPAATSAEEVIAAVNARLAREQAEAKARAEAASPLCTTAVEGRSWACGHKWHVAHPKKRGGGCTHVCGVARGHTKRHRCQGCGRTLRIDPSRRDARQARL